MRNGNDDRTGLILALCGIIPVVWLALLTAPYVGGGIVEIVGNLSVAMGDPFSITVCEDSVRTVLLFLLAYGMGIGIYFSTRRNYRRGEEHGSAKWGDAKALNKKYRDKDQSANKLLTQNVRIGLDGKKHRRNLNILVCGGSGAGKTRFFCKPNAMQCNWNVLQKYIDEGITGTQAKKRPAFLRMLEDARAGKFDLIVTREVCRFARNTVDTLVTTRELKNLGIEVYFVEDNIWTMDGDGELRLTIMATLAQEESRKVSERVRAGQKISRENGVLYGNGNIIGYDRVGSTYVINEEQAETVRIIFDLYLQGAGQTKIAKELCRLGRKDGHGQVSWSASKIGRILHNATYKGYNCYLKSFSNNYLEQKRIKNLDEETYMYVKGDFEPIVSEEIWDKCSEIRKARTTKMIVNKGERTYGKKSTQDVWLRKLRCSCGSTFRKNKWRTNKRGDEVFGYQCYNQVNNGSKAFREKNGLDTEGYCDIRMVGDWKLEIMAKKIFEGIWTEQERKDAILEVYRLLNEYYQSDTKNNQAAASALEGKIARLKNKIDNLISMRADGEITKEEFKSLKDTTEAELNKYMEEKARMSELSNSESGMEFDTEKIRAVLEEALDFSKPKLDDSIIEKFVSQIIPVDNCRYRWDLNFLPNETQSLVCKVEGRKNHADATIEEGSEDEDESPRTYVLSMDYSNISVTAKNAYQSYVLHRQLSQIGRSSLSFELPLSFEQAAACRKANGQYVRKNQWRDTTVRVFIDLD